MTTLTKDDISTPKVLPDKIEWDTEEVIAQRNKDNAQNNKIMRGKPISGRTWKTPSKRLSELTTTSTLKTTWEQKLDAKKHKESLQLKVAELKEQSKKEKEVKKKAREDKKRKREENEKKASSYQVITNSQKIKKMSKKQLKMIRKM